MFEAIARGTFSWDISVLAGGAVVASGGISALRGHGNLYADGRHFKIVREKVFKPVILYKEGGETIALATRRNAFTRWFDLVCEDRVFSMKAKNPFSNSFWVREGGEIVGEVKRTSLFFPRASVSLPDDIPLHVQYCLIWLAFITWKMYQGGG